MCTVHSSSHLPAGGVCPGGYLPGGCLPGGVGVYPGGVCQRGGFYFILIICIFKNGTAKLKENVADGKNHHQIDCKKFAFAFEVWLALKWGKRDDPLYLTGLRIWGNEIALISSPSLCTDKNSNQFSFIEDLQPVTFATCGLMKFCKPRSIYGNQFHLWKEIWRLLSHGLTVLKESLPIETDCCTASNSCASHT